MRNALKWSALLVLALALTGFAAWAQNTGGALQGRIVDEAGQPVIGAMIQVSGPSLQGFQGAATDTTGQYLIPYLPPGTNYQVKVEAPGYNSVVRKGITIPLGVTISLPFTLSQGKTEIVVTAAAPIIDTKKTEIGANISDRVITSIPLGRASGNIAYLAPSVVSNGDRNNQGLSAAIAGSSGLENSITVNGVETINSGNGQSFSNLNFDFIETTEVKTGGMDAEYGGLMGGQINSITKSGGNEFHGGIFAYYYDDGLGAKSRSLENPAITPTTPTFKQYDVGGFLGGYFIKDKLWFFVSYDYNKTQQDTPGYHYVDPYLSNNGHPMASWANGRSVYNDSRDPQYAAKVTWNVSQNHKLSFSFFGDQATYDYLGNLHGNSKLASSFHDETKNYGASIQWNATWTPKFFTEVTVGTRRSWIDDSMPGSKTALDSYMYYYRYGAFRTLPWDLNTNTPAEWVGSGYSMNLNGRLTPNLGTGYYQQEKDFNDQLRIKATNLFNFYGRHELSYGFQYYDITYDRLQSYSGHPYLESSRYDPFYGQYSSRGAYIRWYATSYDFNANGIHDDYVFQTYRSHINDNNKKTKQNYYAYWAQDNWNLTDYFMIKLGVRWDRVHIEGGTNLALQANPTGTGVNGYPIYGKGTITHTPSRSLNINDMVAPRIGFTWDIAHNNKSKLYGFFGQYYQRVPNDIAIRAMTTEWGHNTYFTNPQLTQSYDMWRAVNRPSSFYPAAYTTGFDQTVIEGTPHGGDLKGAYDEEWILGFQYEVAPDFTMGVRAVYRSLGRTIEDISVDGAQQYIVTNPDKWTGVWAPDPRYILFGDTAYKDFRWRFPKPTRYYKALEITADKHFSNHWQLGGSYVLSRMEGNYEGLFSPMNQQVDAFITSTYDLPNLLYNGSGLLANDRTHVLKIYGLYDFDFGLQLSGLFRFQSGIPKNAMGSDPVYGPNEAFLVPRGSAGRLPSTWTLDLGAQYTLKFFKQNFAIRADIFNVTNNQVTTMTDMLQNNTDNNPGYRDNPGFGKETAHQQERRIRLALKWNF